MTGELPALARGGKAINTPSRRFSWHGMRTFGPHPYYFAKILTAPLPPFPSGPLPGGIRKNP